MTRLGRMVWAGVLLLLTAAPGRAQDLPPGFDETFAVASLNPLLRLGADAVVRLDLLRFEVHHPGKATQTVRHVVTVLSADGRDAGEHYIFYDNRLRRLKKLTGLIRDAEGKVIRKLKKDDQEDFSAISGYSLYEESRVRVARLYHHTYPYTVEFEYEVLHDGLINWPTWYPQDDGMAVVFGRFDLVTPPGIKARHMVRGVSLDPVVLQKGQRQMLRWEVAEAPALELEPFGPAWQDQGMAVHTAPTVFEIEGVQGDMRSWQAFGQWYHTLNAGRMTLPPEARNDVQRLTQGLASTREKVQRLYAYLQEKTRYVSIQLGLGGWQTFDAGYVHERGYGDCKALTNYMQALLDEAGIVSYPALIKAGSRASEILPDFPSNQFNHVILYVDLGDEGIWLENTDQTIPFGHLGTFTEDRYALLVKPGGGELVQTPRSQTRQNQHVRHAQIRLTASGDATAQMQMRYAGNPQDEVRQHLAQQPGRARTEWLIQHIDLPSFELVEADFTEVDAGSLALTIPLSLEIPRYASRTGKRLFLPVNLMERSEYVPPPVVERAQPISFFPYAFAQIDSIRFEVPTGFAVEAMPDPVLVETTFGRYSARVEVEAGGILVYQRHLEIRAATLPAAQYDAFRDFMQQIAQADRAQVVLVSS